MVDGEGADLVVAAVDHVTRPELDRLDGIGQVAEDAPQAGEQVAEAGGAVERQRHLATAEREGLQHAGQAEVVVGVEVRQEDVLEVDQADVRAEELSLGALAAVDRAAGRHPGGSSVADVARWAVGAEPDVPRNTTSRSTGRV